MGKVKVRVHTAIFVDDPDKVRHYFVNVINKHNKRSITIIDVKVQKPIPHGIESSVQWIPVNPEGRHTPAYVPPRSEWETWIKVKEIGENALDRFVVTTADGKKYSSKKRIRVPQEGIIPGNK